MSDDWDLLGTAAHGPVKTHGESACTGRPCVIHAPTDHHMRNWPLSFDFQFFALGLRTCEHGYTHPDPDSVTHVKTLMPEGEGMWWTVHTCDYCCAPPEVES